MKTRPWTTEEIADFRTTENLPIRTAGRADHLRGRTLVWVVTHDDSVYVRSYRGVSGAWYRRALVSPAGEVTVMGTGVPVLCEPAGAENAEEVSDAYRAKYGRFSYVSSIVTELAVAATMRLTALDGGSE